ncbi:MAG: hypothetical protein HZB99_01555 [Candidatus Harrisonbacteria bacterium]|nr:hypothetical protein [Candidatus Harrisonbacteria bacterium]
MRKRRGTISRLSRKKTKISKSQSFFGGIRLISFISAVVIATVYVVFIVSGAANTTIGNNISTNGSLSVSGTTTFNGVSYTWPSADGLSGRVLSTNGSGGLSWSAASSQWTTSGSNIYFTGGNAGVGTTTPNWLLQAAGTRPFFALSDISAGSNLKHWTLSSQGGNLYIATSTDAYATSSISALMISNAGNIGISGVATSTAKLFITDGVATGSPAYSDLVPQALSWQAAAGNAYTGIENTAYGIKVAMSSFNDSESGSYGEIGTATNHPFRLFTNTATALNITTSQLIGIGTSTPYARLTVWGDNGSGKSFEVVNNASSTLFMVKEAGNVGISSTSPSQTFSVQGNSLLSGNLGVASVTATGTLTLSGISGTSTIASGQGFAIGTSQLVVVGATGDIGIGITNPIADFQVIGKSYFGTETSLSSDLTSAFGTPRVVSVGNNNSADGFVNITEGNNAVGARFRGAKTRSTDNDADTIVQSGDNLLELTSFGADGASYRSAAEILMEVDGTPGSSDMPGRIVFSTTPDGSATLNERMRITNAGLVGIGTTSPSAALALENSAVNTKPALLIKAGGAGDGNIAISVDADDTCRDSVNVATCVLNDLAELFPTTEELEGGDIVMFDPENPFYIKKALMTNDSMTNNLLAGVISTSPAIVFEGSGLKALGGKYTSTLDKAPLALSGRIPVKVNLEGGDIQIGDPITISSIPGVGKKATQTGKIIGYALEPLTTQSQSYEVSPHKIMIFANLTYYQSSEVEPPDIEVSSSGGSTSNLLSLIIDTVKNWLNSMQVTIENGKYARGLRHASSRRNCNRRTVAATGAESSHKYRKL